MSVGSYVVSFTEELFDPTAFIKRIPVKTGFISLFLGGLEGLILYDSLILGVYF